MSYEEKDRKFARSEQDKTLSENMPSLSDSDPSPDQELKAVLRYWSAPGAPARLGSRVMESYRRQVSHRSWWRPTRSFWLASLPAPLAVGASLCLVAFAIFQRSSSHRNAMTVPSLEHLTIEETDVEISGDELRYVTYIRGSGFQPVRGVRIEISRGGDQNED